jgi:two-component system, NarL family, response regulator LiaR
VRLLLADHDPLARKAVREAMATRDDVLVVGEASNSNDSIAAVLEHAPDIVLLDVDLPPAGGVAATAQLLGIAPMVRVVLFTVREDEELGLAGLQAGATGFLSKDIDMSALARALKSVAGGEAAVSRRMALQAIIRLRSMASQLTSMRPVRSPLTNRQWEVLDLLAEGQGIAEIAQRLRVSVDTVRGHVRMLLRALGASSPAEAVRLADRLRSGHAGT